MGTPSQTIINEPLLNLTKSGLASAKSLKFGNGAFTAEVPLKTKPLMKAVPFGVNSV
jgi:hypothetical protein